MFLFIDFLQAHIKRDEDQALCVVDKMTEPEARHLNQMLQNVGWDPKALLMRLKAKAPARKNASAAKRRAIITTVTIPAEKKSTGKVPVRAKR